VTYTGVLPDLFREGQGVVAEGTLAANGVFHADRRAIFIPFILFHVVPA
jgi:cytochrome c-type biogenesis protein CcmE